MCLNNLPKVATQWDSGATRDSDRGRRVLIPSALTTRPPNHTYVVCWKKVTTIYFLLYAWKVGLCIPLYTQTYEHIRKHQGTVHSNLYWLTFSLLPCTKQNKFNNHYMKLPSMHSSHTITINLSNISFATRKVADINVPSNEISKTLTKKSDG